MSYISYRWYFPIVPAGMTTQPSLKVSTQNTASAPLLVHPRIVLLLPLSGIFQREGGMLRDGIALAHKELLAQGTELELTVLDSAQGSEEAVRMSRELISNPDILFVVAHLPTAVLSQVISDYQRAGLPLLIPANSHESLSAHPWALTLTSSDQSEGENAAKLAGLWDENNPAVVIHDPGQYGRILAEGFKMRCSQDSLPVRSVACRKDDPDFEAILSQVVVWNPSVVWLAGPPPWGAAIAKALVEKHFPGRLLAPHSYGRMISDDLFGEISSRLHFVWPTLLMQTPGDPEELSLQEFRKSFLRQFLREPDSFAILGYDAMRCAGAILRQGPVSRTELREHFLSYNSPGRTYQGLGGPFYFDSTGHVQRNLCLVTYRQGKLTVTQSAR